MSVKAKRERTEATVSAQNETWVVAVLRGLALAVAAAALLLDVSLPVGTAAAVLGTFAAALASGWLARSRARLPLVWVVAGLCGASALLIGMVLVNETLPAELLGPRRAMEAADVMRFGLLAVALTLALRTTSARRPSFAIVELVLVAASLANVVAAHRDGAINRPRFLSDWAWTHGIDPTLILLYIGCGTLAALLVATLHERRGRGLRVALHLLFLLALAAAAFFFFRTDDVLRGLRGGQGQSNEQRGKGKGDDKKGSKDGQGKAGGGQGGQQGANQPLPFRNDNNSQSNAPVAVVLLHDDYSPPLGYYYFRQSALSQFNGHRLVASTRDDLDRDVPGSFPTQPTPIEGAPKPEGGRVEIHTTVALLADHGRPFGLESPMEMAPRQSPDPARFVRAYDVTSAALAVPYAALLGRKPGVRAWTDEQRAAYTQLPDDPRYKQLADQIVDESLRPEFRHDPFAEAIAVSAWLGKHSIYSIHAQHADDKDPTADFLFGDRVGYCVHFAHAAAYLLRARGLPTRIAEGYAADESRRGNGSTILLRQKDAHAWAELYLDGFGWIVVDVAPQQVLDPPDTPPDPELQRMLGELARGNPTAGTTPDGKAKKSQLGRYLRDAGLGASLLMLLAVLALYSVKLWRRLIPSFAGPRSIHRVAYRATLDALVESGLRRRHGETRERYSARVDLPPFEPLTRAHVGCAYGTSPGRLPSVAETRDLAAASARLARRRARWWRRLLGLLDPTSWLRAK